MPVQTISREPDGTTLILHVTDSRQVAASLLSFLKRANTENSFTEGFLDRAFFRKAYLDRIGI
jgi:hypothetical protein